MLRKSKICSSQGDQDLIVHDLDIMARGVVSVSSSKSIRVTTNLLFAVSQRLLRANEEANRRILENIRSVRLERLGQSPWFWYDWGDKKLIILEG